MIAILIVVKYEWENPHLCHQLHGGPLGNLKTQLGRLVRWVKSSNYSWVMFQQNTHVI
jgi:hypothetical protein